MKKLYFLLPGTRGKFGGGGLWAELNTYRLAQQICPAQVVTYRQREKEHPFLDDILRRQNLEAAIFIISWGFDIPRLIKRLQASGVSNIVYHAHSTGYRFNLPGSIPIITVSRHSMGYWGQKSPNSPIYYLPNHIGEKFYNRENPRDIDVLVQARKSSHYLLKQLVPALQNRCRVELLDSYVEDLAGLFNQSKIYLYDSAEYWAVSGVTEGFGLPPLEAMACGCQVFSSVNTALADYLDPGFNCHKIAVYDTEYDVQRILNVLHSSSNQPLPEEFFAPYRTPNLLSRLEIILGEINAFFDAQKKYRGDIPGLSKTRIMQLCLGRTLTKIKNKLKK